MTTPIFSQAAVYRLQKLASAVNQQDGVRHRLSESGSLMTLLRQSEASRDAKTIRHYQEFLNILSDEQAEGLTRQGLQLKPRAMPSAPTQRAS